MVPCSCSPSLWTPAPARSIAGRQRAKQQNFQLVVITHDEHFLELLHRFGMGRVYYRVKKTP